MAHKRNAKATASDEPYLQIGEAAERIGVTQRTLRFYEERGLLKPPTRMDGGFRLYSEDDITRVEQIRRLRQLLGFPLADIKDIVEAEEVTMQLKAQYRPEAALSHKKAQLLRAIQVTQHQYDLIRQKTDALAEMRAKLEERLTRFRGWQEDLDKRLAAESKPKAKTKSEV